jgi:hypothetical protein
VLGSLGIPAARAAFAAIGVLAFVYYWREFNEPLLYIQSIEKYTLSVGLAYLEQLDPTNWPLLMAGSVVITAPSWWCSWWRNSASWSVWIVPGQRPLVAIVRSYTPLIDHTVVHHSYKCAIIWPCHACINGICAL